MLMMMIWCVTEASNEMTSSAFLGVAAHQGAEKLIGESLVARPTESRAKS